MSELDEFLSQLSSRCPTRRPEVATHPPKWRREAERRAKQWAAAEDALKQEKVDLKGERKIDSLNEPASISLRLLCRSWLPGAGAGVPVGGARVRVPEGSRRVRGPPAGGGRGRPGRGIQGRAAGRDEGQGGEQEWRHRRQETRPPGVLPQLQVGSPIQRHSEYRDAFAVQFSLPQFY